MRGLADRAGVLVATADSGEVADWAQGPCLVAAAALVVYATVVVGMGMHHPGGLGDVAAVVPADLVGTAAPVAADIPAGAAIPVRDLAGAHCRVSRGLVEGAQAGSGSR